MSEPQKHYSKWNKSSTEDHILYDSTSVGYLENENPQKYMESVLRFPKASREGNANPPLSSAILVWKGPEFYKLDCGDGCTILWRYWRYLKPLNIAF